MSPLTLFPTHLLPVLTDMGVSLPRRRASACLLLLRLLTTSFWVGNVLMAQSPWLFSDLRSQCPDHSVPNHSGWSLDGQMQFWVAGQGELAPLAFLPSSSCCCSPTEMAERREIQIHHYYSSLHETKWKVQSLALVCSTGEGKYCQALPTGCILQRVSLVFRVRCSLCCCLYYIQPSWSF